MRIAFYAPLKAPTHPVPSGDRQMARLLMRALAAGGHEVALASELRSYAARPEAALYAPIRQAAEKEAARLASLWRRRPAAAPDLWFTYHSYYKSPDLLGPRLAKEIDIPYVVAEASYSARRAIGEWAETQRLTVEALGQAAAILCLTERDAAGLRPIVNGGRLAMLSPFIDTQPFAAEARPEAGRLITVAMMRPGDKLESYRLLAAALAEIADRPWTLTVVGDGPCRAEVAERLGRLPAGRVEWVGEKEPAAVAALLQRAAIYVWPGFGEAYGLAYLEAQAAGLPVVAQNIAGVPEVAIGGETAILVPAGDAGRFAGAIAALLDDEARRRAMGAAARRFVTETRSLPAGAARLAYILGQLR